MTLRCPLLIAAFASLLAANASAQSVVTQAGPTGTGHAPMYVYGGNTPIVQDSGPASGGPAGMGLSELLLMGRGYGTAPYSNFGSGPNYSNLCSYDGPTSGAAGYHYLCFNPNYNGSAGLITYGAAGAASQLPLEFSINGALYGFSSAVGANVIGPASSTVGDVTAFNSTTGTLLQDTGIASSSLLTNTAAATAAHIPVWSSSISTGGKLVDSGYTIATLPQIANAVTYNSNIAVPATGDLAQWASSSTVTGSSVVAANVVQNPSAVAATNNLAMWSTANAAGNTLVDAGISTALLMRANSTSTVSGNLPSYTANGSVITADSGVNAAKVQTVYNYKSLGGLTNGSDNTPVLNGIYAGTSAAGSVCSGSAPITLYFPAGTYTFQSPITVPAGCWVNYVGESAATVTFNFSSIQSSGFFLDIAGVRASGTLLTGNVVAGATSLPVGTATAAGFAALYTPNNVSCQAGTLTDCYYYNPTVGVGYSAPFGEIVNFPVASSGAGSLAIAAPLASYHTASITYVSPLTMVGPGIISGITFQGYAPPPPAGALVSPTTQGVRIGFGYRIIVRDNVFNNAGQANQLEITSCVECDVSNNYFTTTSTKMDEYALAIAGNSQDVDIHDNKFYNYGTVSFNSSINTTQEQGIVRRAHIHHNQMVAAGGGNGQGIEGHFACEEVWIEDNDIYGPAADGITLNPYALRLHCNSGHINRNHIAWVQNSAIYIEPAGTVAADYEITGNVISNLPVAGSKAIIANQSAIANTGNVGAPTVAFNRLKITGNMISSINGLGISITSPPSVATCPGTVNTCNAYNGYNIQIEGNNITDINTGSNPSTQAILVQNANNFQINHNIISNIGPATANGGGQSARLLAAGIEVVSSQFGTISSNQIYMPASGSSSYNSHGIEVNGTGGFSGHITVSGNQAYVTGGSGSYSSLDFYSGCTGSSFGATLGGVYPVYLIGNDFLGGASSFSPGCIVSSSF